MGQLHYFVITNIVFITMLFCVGVAEATGQDAITSLESSDMEIRNNFSMKAYNNSCECIKYDCGCCQHLEWDTVSMDGKLCLNASYLENDYFLSLTTRDFTHDNV